MPVQVTITVVNVRITYMHAGIDCYVKVVVFSRQNFRKTSIQVRIDHADVSKVPVTLTNDGRRFPSE